MIDTQGEPGERFAAAVSWFERVYEDFIEFRDTPIGEKYEEALGAFLHDALRAGSNLRLALDNDTVPEAGRACMRWVDYNRTVMNIQLMELILELARGGSEDIRL